MDKYLGKRLDGRYEIHELIGIGGMANVYRCTDTLDDREVAIKILKDEFLNNEEFIRRFKNESKAIAMLSHPNIVKVYDVSFGDMIQYIVMEYIDGITLKEYIERQGVIEWKDALHLTTQVLRALQHAHESGIVLQDGTIKVTDFGIARFSDKATRTMTDQAIGSVHYIAPEQARGDVTDGKTDIYSVGVMLYEMLAGKLPFDGDSAVSVALMQLNEEPKRPREINPSIPVGLEQITIRAMEKEPNKRYTSAAEMLSDIDRFRLNPSIVFDYGSSYVDDQPTKFVEDKDKDKEMDAAKELEKEKAREEKREKKEKKEKEKAERREKKAKEKEEARKAAEEKKAEKTETVTYADEEYKEHGNGYYAFKGILIAAVLLALIFGVLAIVRGITSNQAKDVQVPAYVGKSLMEIKENNPENFQFEIKSRYDQSQTPGVVLAQDPVEYMTVKSGSVVTLTVNSSDDEIAVPFFNSSFKKEDVVKKIKELGLVPEEVKVEDANAAKDYVVGTFPVAGAKAPVGSTVYIYVSNGERPGVVEIPSVIGMTLSEAEETLENLGITVQTRSDDESREKKDTVIAATPLPHGKVEAGTVVELTVSSGKGDKSKVTLNVDMPKNVYKMIELTVTVDGERDEEKTQQVNPIETPTVKIEIENSGTKTVVVLLDNQPYREYKLDFTLGTVNTTVYEYVPVTEAPTYYVEPYTEYVDPYSGGGYVDPNAYDSTVYDPNAYLYSY